MVLLIALLACSSPSPLPPSVEVAGPVVDPPPPAPGAAVAALPAPALAPAEPAEPVADPPKPALPRPRAGDLPDAARLPEGDYTALVTAIEQGRRTFARFDAVDEARAWLQDAITEHLIPAWKGTRWAFYGKAEAPGGGEIACGYWVASVLRDAGFRIKRDQVGKQASERILLTLAEPSRLKHFGRRPVTEVIASVQRAGEGLWGVGLANHAGFLWNDGASVWFCHSNYNGTRGPECELAERSWAFHTSYTVIAPLLADATMAAWLEGRDLPTGAFGS